MDTKFVILLRGRRSFDVEGINGGLFSDIVVRLCFNEDCEEETTARARFSCFCLAFLSSAN